MTQPIVDGIQVSADNPFAQSIESYTKNAVATVAPTDARIGSAYKILISEIVKVSTGSLKAEEAINEALEVRE